MAYRLTWTSQTFDAGEREPEPVELGDLLHRRTQNPKAMNVREEELVRQFSVFANGGKTADWLPG